MSKLILMGGGVQESNRGGHDQRGGRGDAGGADRDVRWHRQDSSCRKRQHSRTFTPKIIENHDYEIMRVKKMVERWEVLEKDSGTSPTPPEHYKSGLGDVQLLEESPMKRRKLQQRNDPDCGLPTPASKSKSRQRNSPWRQRPVSGAPPRARSSSSPWKNPEQQAVPSPTAVYSVYHQLQSLEPGKLSTGARWPPTQPKLDGTSSLSVPVRGRSGSSKAELPVLYNHTEVHPPLTVMPGQAVHPRHLDHQV